jgi:hypothetical protein
MGPKRYKLDIVTRPSVISNGKLFEPQTVFSCEVLLTGDAGITDFSNQLLSFWENSNAIGDDAHGSWSYEAVNIKQVPI